MKHFQQKGSSLIELLFTLMLLSLILFTGFHTFQGFLMRTERDLFLNELKEALEFARAEAFLRNSTISLCGSHSKQRCHLDKDWSTGFIVYENKHQNLSINDGSILRRVNGVKHGRILFNGVSPHIQVPAEGLTMTIGRFMYCPKNKAYTEVEIDGLIINRALRSYYLKESQEKISASACFFQ